MNVSFLTNNTQLVKEEEEPSSPVPTLESVVSLVTASTSEATVAALAAVEGAESTPKGVYSMGGRMGYVIYYFFVYIILF